MRKLSFPIILLLILRKSVKPLQCFINELFVQLKEESVSNGAFSQGRLKLKWTAFVELPNTPQVIEEFGQIRYNNQGQEGHHACGIALVLYNVCNKIADNSYLGDARSYEVELSISHHLSYLKAGDILLCDRGYLLYHILAHLNQSAADYVIHCSKNSFVTARELFKGSGNQSQIVTLKASDGQRKKLKAQCLPTEIKVRFVSVVLETGEIAVLITSIPDLNWQPNDFKQLYHLRWGIETFYGILKTRLEPENFTGLTADVNQALSQKPVKNPQQVNHSESFNAIKNQAIELLLGDDDIDVLIIKLEALFRKNPTLLRPHRKVERQKNLPNHLLQFWKRRRKHSF